MHFLWSIYSFLELTTSTFPCLQLFETVFTFMKLLLWQKISSKSQKLNAGGKTAKQGNLKAQKFGFPGIGTALIMIIKS